MSSWAGTQDGENAPHYNQVLTIRGIDKSGSWVGLRFIEVLNAKREYADGFVECAFGIKWFRPLITQQDDIAMFKSLMMTSPVYEKSE